MKVLFIGANPSPKNTDATVPFEGTQSGEILKTWIHILGIKPEDCGFLNISDTVTKEVSQIKKKDIDIQTFFFNVCMKSAEMFHGQPLATLILSAKLQSENRLNAAFEKQSDADLKKHLALMDETDMPKIIPLGKLAAWGIEQTGLEFHELPHPSGRNRKLNDKDALQKTLDDCRAWLYSEPVK